MHHFLLKSNGLKRIACGCLAALWWLTPVMAQEVAPEGEPLRQQMTVKQIIDTGGVPMYVLAVMSVIGLAMVFYFLIALRENQVVPHKFESELRRLLGAGRLEEALQISSKNRSALGAVAQSAIAFQREADGIHAELVKDIIEGEGSRQATMMQNQLQYLQDIAVIAPMIGLLGTVLGMLTAFNAVALDIAKAQPMVLAQGVSQALITTAAGLIVGIPAMMAYAYFRGRTSRLLSGLEAASAELLAQLIRTRTP